MAGRPKVGTGTSVHPKGYKSNPDSIPLDRYDYILQESNRHSSKQKKDIEIEKVKQRNELNNTVIRQIQNMNFISIWPNADQIDKCVCEGKEFGSKERLTIKYRKNRAIKELFVDGKICKDCGRKIVIKKLLLDAYHKAEG